MREELSLEPRNWSPTHVREDDDVGFFTGPRLSEARRDCAQCEVSGCASG